MQALHRQIVRIVGPLARLRGPLDERGVQALADLLRLLVQHLLRHLFPGEAQVALHGDHAQADDAPGREHERPGVMVVALAGEMLLDRIVRQIAGGDDVRQQRTAFAAHAQALGQMHFDEVAMPPAELAERIERLDRTRALGPAAAHAAGQGDHGDTSFGQRLHAALAMPGVEFVRSGIFDAAADRQAILRQANAAGTQIGLDPLMLHAVEPVGFEQCFQAQSAAGLLILRARQQVIEEIVHHAGEVFQGAAGGGEAFQFRAASGGEVARFGAQKRRHGQRVITGGHEGVGAGEYPGLGAALIDGEVVDHRFHGERHRVLHGALGLAHDDLHALLRFGPAQQRMQVIMSETKRAMEHSVPFAMEPVVYNFAINERGTEAGILTGANALMPAGYYTLAVPPLLRTESRNLSAGRRAELERFTAACRTLEDFSGMVHNLFDHLLPRAQDEQTGRALSLEVLLETHGFDRVQHERIQTDLRSGRIGLAQNRLPVSSRIEDAAPDELDARHRERGMQALAEGRVAVVTLAGGVGSRWTKGAGAVKALNPFCKLGGRHRNFIETHLAKSLRVGRECGTLLPHIVTTSYLTHDWIERHLAREANYHYPGPLLLSPGRIIGLRMVPMERDLRFAWEEMPQQMLDEQAQKVREGLHAALIKWAAQAGEGSNYTDNLPMQCLHPVGHWYEVPNLLRNGTLLRLLAERPRLNYLLVHNIDTAAVDVDAALLGQHISSGCL